MPFRSQTYLCLILSQDSIIGEPNVSALPDAEQRTFFETLLARIMQLKESDNNE